jgi:hypothetical protein
MTTNQLKIFKKRFQIKALLKLINKSMWITLLVKCLKAGKFMIAKNPKYWVLLSPCKGNQGNKRFCKKALYFKMKN